jgi:pilus assembly protein CpaE
MSHAKGTEAFMLNPDPQLNTAAKRYTTADEATQDADTGARPEDHSRKLLGVGGLYIALISPDDRRRFTISGALAWFRDITLSEFASYPRGLDDVPRLLEQPYDVIVIDLDSDPEYALELVENVSTGGTATVMVYSAKADRDMLVRCMRAGAREFLTIPVDHNTLAEALVRAAARRSTERPVKKAGGKTLVFMGAKGGAGVTTMACNFAVALAQDTGQRTLLIDLDLPLGDAALNLGIVTEYSTVNALQNYARLDANFLSTLLVQHSSGLYVLPAPGKFPEYHAENEAIDRLLAVAREEFDNIVVDVGSRLNLTGTALFRDAYTIYLVTQAGIPELRNSNRLITHFFSETGPKLEVIINRYESRMMGVSDEHITKALTRPAQWTVPNDYEAVRNMQITATPLTQTDLPISRLIRRMACAASGIQETPVKKKKAFGLFG